MTIAQQAQKENALPLFWFWLESENVHTNENFVVKVDTQHNALYVYQKAWVFIDEEKTLEENLLDLWRNLCEWLVFNGYKINK